MSERDDAAQQLAFVSAQLESLFGFSAAEAQSPTRCLTVLATATQQTDWRDAFMATLAGGHSAHVAKSTADLAVKLLREHRAGAHG